MEQPQGEPCAIVHRETRDADEQAACLAHWEQVYEQLTPGPFVGSFACVSFSGFQLFREVTNKGVHQAGLICQDDRAFGIPVSMRGNGSFCGRPVTPDSLITMKAGEEFDFRAPEDLELVAATVPLESLAQYAWDIEGLDIEQKLHDKRVISSPEVDAVRTYLVVAMQYLTEWQAPLRYLAMQKVLINGLLGYAVKALEDVQGTPQTTPPASTRHAVVSRAQEYMREHVDAPLTVEDLCRVVNVSRRTLQYSFQEVLQLNPVSYLRAIRLSGARRTLKTADAARDSVQDIAARWGFWHLSRFASDYRKMFGELPSETLRGRRTS